MTPEEREEFLRVIEEAEEAVKRYEAYMEEMDQFTREMIQTVGFLTYDYFTREPPHPYYERYTDIDQNELMARIRADEQFRYYGIWMYEELCMSIDAFMQEELPPNWQLSNKKVEWPSYSEEALEEKVNDFIGQCRVTLTPEQVQDVWDDLRDNFIFKEYGTNFRIEMHNALKKLALKYFPEIMDIHPVGYREIDYDLYIYMLLNKENIWDILLEMAEENEKIANDKES
jgi:hypothetical protein